MKRVLILLILFCAAPTAAGELRIISHLPALTEIAFSLGLGEQVVGVSPFCRTPPEAALLPRVGGLADPSFESIVALRPTLALLDESMTEHRAVYGRLGVRTVMATPSSVLGVTETIRLIGQATGTRERAWKLAADLTARLDTVRKRYAGRPPVRTLLVVGHAPGSLSNLFVAARRSFHDELLRFAGGVNCLAADGAGYIPVSKEVVVAADPEAVIVLMAGADGSAGAQDRERRLWRVLGAVRAVKHGRIFLLTESYVSQPGPRMPVLAEALGRCLHPELPAKDGR